MNMNVSNENHECLMLTSLVIVHSLIKDYDEKTIKGTVIPGYSKIN